MKKIFSLIAVILSAALIFVGCSSKTEKKEDSSSRIRKYITEVELQKGKDFV